MKSFIFALITTLFIVLVITIFITTNLLFEYLKINEKIKDDNWELTKENTQLEQLSNACAKELKECKGDLNTIKALVPEATIKERKLPMRINERNKTKLMLDKIINR